MFPAAMDGQRQRFYRALYRLAVTRDEGLDDYLAKLGRAHRKFGVRKGHYAEFRTALPAAAYRFTPPGQALVGETPTADAPGEDAAAAEESEETGGAAWLAAFDRAVEIMAGAAETTPRPPRRGGPPGSPPTTCARRTWPCSPCGPVSRFPTCPASTCRCRRRAGRGCGAATR
jgi:hypothetical protein